MKKKHKIAIFALVIVIIFFIVGNSNNAPSIKEGPSEEKSNQAEIVAQEVDVTQFISEFDQNQLSAEEKYKNKKVKLTAFIQNISEDFTGTPYLSLKPSLSEYYFGTTIKCSFGDKSSLTSLKNGQQITLSGITESQSLGIINLKNCEISDE